MEMANNENVKSARERQLERMRTKYPDKKFDDDEGLFGQIYDDYDQYENELKGHREREDKLSKMFAADPRSAQFLTDMHQGKSPWASYIRLFGPELKDGLDDPETIEQIAEAEREYVERVAKSQELDREYEQNIERTIETLRSFQSEQGLSDEEVDAVMASLLGIVRDGVMGKFESATLLMMVKAINHDKDVAMASEEGEVAGRNAKISERLRKGAQGDGIAVMSGQPGHNGGNRQGGKSIFDLAAEAQ